MWKCTTCDRQFEAIPENAVRLTRTKARTNVFRFSDGAIHSLCKMRRPKSESISPPLEPPKEDTALLQAVVKTLAEMPKPQPEIKSEPEIEIEAEPMTSMELAFRRQREQ